MGTVGNGDGLGVAVGPGPEDGLHATKRKSVAAAADSFTHPGLFLNSTDHLPSGDATTSEHTLPQRDPSHLPLQEGHPTERAAAHARHLQLRSTQPPNRSRFRRADSHVGSRERSGATSSRSLTSGCCEVSTPARIALARLGRLCPVATTVEGIPPVPELDAKNTLIQSDTWPLQGRLSHRS